MSERLEQARAFLDSNGWRGAEIAPRPGDASTRSYARVTQGGRKAMLMDQPQSAETPAGTTRSSSAASTSSANGATSASPRQRPRSFMRSFMQRRLGGTEYTARTLAGTCPR